MGMAASQVRFLSLQNRKNTIGLNLMTLSNRRMALSRDMNRVSTEYNNAMNQRVLKWSNDSGVTYQNLNYDLLMKPSDLNANLPFILTDAQGRVVLDDNNIVLDGKDTKVTYRDLATMISAYSGVVNNKTEYNNTKNLTDNTLTVEQIKDIENHPSGATSGVTNENGYKIITNVQEYNFQNSLRYDLMTKLGLISESENTEFSNIIDRLYGTEKAYNNGDYGELLKSFDSDRAKATTEFGDKIFGKLDTADGVFKIKDNTGCAMGNLALAKAYQAEYQAYLNTEIPQDILVDTKRTIATSTADLDKLDETNVTNTEYKYDEFSNRGISNRMLALLTQTGDIKKDDKGVYQLEVSGLLKNLGFYNSSGEKVTYQEAFNSDTGVNGGMYYHTNATGRFDSYIDYKSFTGNWGTLYDYDGGLNDKKSYDNGDGVFQGEDYIDNIDNKTTGIGIKLDDSKEYSAESRQDLNTNTTVKDALTTVVNSFANSMKQVPNINKDYVDEAAKLTIKLYVENNQWVEGDGHNSSRKASQEAAEQANDIFGFGVANNKHDSEDPVILSIPNMVNAFITFYNMLDAVNGDKTRIKGSAGDLTFKDDVVKHYNVAYNSDFAEKMKQTSPLLAELNEWKNSGGEVNCTQPSTNGTHTVKYTKTSTETDKDGKEVKYTEYATVTGYWSDSGFSSITKIEFSYDDKEGTEKKDKTYTAGASGIDGSQNVTAEVYGEDDNVAYTVNYNYNRLNDKTTAEITLETADDKIKDVKTILVENNSITGLKNKSGNNLKNSDYQENGKPIYYIVTEPNGEIRDDKYQYEINSRDVKKSTFAATIKTKPVDRYSKQLAELVKKCQEEVDSLKKDLENKYAIFESRGMDYFDALFKMISEKGWVYDANVNNKDEKDKSNNYLNAMLENNMYFITEVDTLDGTDFNYATKLVTNVSKIFQVYDTDAQNVALSKYEAEKADINTKEKQLDVRINKLEAEQDAIKTELQAIKKVIEDNVSNTFKIFS